VTWFEYKEIQVDVTLTRCRRVGMIKYSVSQWLMARRSNGSEELTGSNVGDNFLRVQSWERDYIAFFSILKV